MVEIGRPVKDIEIDSNTSIEKILMNYPSQVDLNP